MTNFHNTIRPSFRLLIALLAGIAIALPATTLAASKKKRAAPPKERVVIQVSESDSKRWNLVLNTAKALQGEFGEDKIEVAVVAFGPGVNMLKNDADVANRIQAAIERKIVFIAGEASLKALNVATESLTRGVLVVPSGSTEIIKRQRSGWAYLRP